MDLTDLLYKFMPSSLYRGAAQSRTTRTPIIAGNLPSGTGGIYQDSDLGWGSTSPLDALKLLAAQLPMTGKFITVDPTQNKNTGGIDDTLRHEDIHAALAPVTKQLPALQSDPLSQVIKQQIGIGREGTRLMPNVEAPAYMGAYQGQAFTGVSQGLRDLYLQHFQDQLKQVSPAVAKQYDSLAHPSAIGATAAAGENGGSQ